MKDIKIFTVDNLSNLIIVAVTVIPMAYSGAPFWACWGTGWVLWMACKTMDWSKHE